MKRVCVYCGSNFGLNPRFRESAVELGNELVNRGIGLVYGGASVGIMGTIADAVLERGGEAIGVIPSALAHKEIAHPSLSKLHIVGSMHERKALMAELSDGFIALPGGWGTIEEIFEVLTWAQLGFHRKPCGLFNVESYYDHLFAFLEHAIDQQFVKAEYWPMLIMRPDADSILDAFANYQAPDVKKWISPSET
jgi:uncharacterized protein (TIGR00730 family)